MRMELSGILTDRDFPWFLLASSFLPCRGFRSPLTDSKISIVLGFSGLLLLVLDTWTVFCMFYVLLSYYTPDLSPNDGNDVQ